MLLPTAAAPRYMEDFESDICVKCHDEFTLFNRKHHCRLCGGLFCNACAGNWAYIPFQKILPPPPHVNLPLPDYREPQRCCHECRITLPRNASSAASRTATGPSTSSTSSSASSSGAGSRSWVEVDCHEYTAGSPSKRYAVAVPTDIRRGQTFQVSLDDRIMTVSLPPHVSPGDSILVRAPALQASRSSTSTSTPSHHHHHQPVSCTVCTFECPSGCLECTMCGSPLETLNQRHQHQYQHQHQQSPSTVARQSNPPQPPPPPPPALPPRVLELSPEDETCEYDVVVPEGVQPDDVFQVILGRRQRVFSLICPSDARAGSAITVLAPEDVEEDANADEDEDEGKEDDSCDSEDSGISIGCESSDVNDEAIVHVTAAAVAQPVGTDEDGNTNDTSEQELTAVVHPASLVSASKTRRRKSSRSGRAESKTGGAAAPREELVDDTATTAQISEAIRDSLLLTKKYPLQHLHYTLQSDQDLDELGDFRASLLDPSSSELDQDESDLAERRRRFLALAEEPITVGTAGASAGKSEASDGKSAGKDEDESQPVGSSASWGGPAGKKSEVIKTPAKGSPRSTVAGLKHVDRNVTQATQACPACTLLNPPLAILCMACETPLDNGVSPRRSVGSSKEPSRREEQYDGDIVTAEPFLNCPCCTLENLPGTRVCVACDQLLVTPNNTQQQRRSSSSNSNSYGALPSLVVLSAERQP